MASNLEVADVPVRWVSDEQYEPTLLSLVAKAKRLFMASMFIADPSPRPSGPPRVVQLARQLSHACDRGVLVRLVLGGSSDSFDIGETVLAAAELFSQLGVPCRVAALAGRSSHKKVVVADEYILLGSHNWSEKAWTGQIQDSILIQGSGLAAYLANVIEAEWESLEE